MSLFESTKPQKSRAFWPDTSYLQGAIDAARQGMWAAYIVAVFTAVFAAIAIATSPIAGIDGWAFIDSGIFAGLGYGIRRYSRTAALVALVFFFGEKIYMWSVNGPNGIFLTIVLLLAFGSGVRGTFAYHALTQRGSLVPTTGPGTVG